MMPRAEIYYYPSGVGHIGVNIIFSKEELPQRNQETNKYLISSRSSDRDHKLEARGYYEPLLFLNGNGEYSIYGYKEGAWRETPLNDLSQEEHILLQNLSFDDVYLQENDEYFACNYQNGVWNKESVVEKGWRGSPHHKKTQTSDPLYSLLQKGHDFQRTEFFYDYGGSYDFEINIDTRGQPIRIVLPSTTISTDDFFRVAYDEGGYTINAKPENLVYRLFSHNCAHATEWILHAAGYLPTPPSQTSGLAPITVAKRAAQLARQSRPAFRKQLIESNQHTDKNELIDTLIELSKNRLSDITHFRYGNYIGGTSEEYERLSKIQYDGSYESIERLLEACEKASAHTLEELEQCIALADPELCLKAGIARLESVAKGLKNKSNAKELELVITGLNQEFKSFKKNQLTHEQFCQNCSKWIDKANPILKSEDKLFLQILKNIALAVCSLVAVYLVAAFINQSNTGNLMFFKEPSVSTIGKGIQQNIDRMKP